MQPQELISRTMLPSRRLDSLVAAVAEEDLVESDAVIGGLVEQG